VKPKICSRLLAFQSFLKEDLAMTMKAMLPAAFAALILVGGAALVSAHPIEDSEEAQERAALQNAKITLSEAIAAAEKEVPGGKVTDAEVDIVNGAASYVVEIDKDGLQTVRVDLETGKALKVAAEADDADDTLVTVHRDDEDEDDDEEGDDD
jgi:uncharacterized membrane protein YkoI